MIWDNVSAYLGEAVKDYLPNYSPDFNAYEAIWGWVRQEAARKLLPGNQGAGSSRKSARFSQGFQAARRRCSGVADLPPCQLLPY